MLFTGHRVLVILCGVCITRGPNFLLSRCWRCKPVWKMKSCRLVRSYRTSEELCASTFNVGICTSLHGIILQISWIFISNIDLLLVFFQVIKLWISNLFWSFFSRSGTTYLLTLLLTYLLYYLLTYLLTNSMEQSPSWEADQFSASQEIPRILCNKKVYHRGYKSPCIPTLSQIKPVHAPFIPLSENLQWHHRESIPGPSD